MLKRAIKYQDFDGNEITEEFYFNISQPELIEMEVEYKEGFSTWIENVVKTEDNKELIKQFKELVLRSYGQKSEDGKRFIKSEELSKEFSQTNAYSALFMELATNEGAAADFVKGILPKDMVKDVDKALTAVPPTPPDVNS